MLNYINEFTVGDRVYVSNREEQTIYEGVALSIDEESTPVKFNVRIDGIVEFPPGSSYKIGEVYSLPKGYIFPHTNDGYYWSLSWIDGNPFLRKNGEIDLSTRENDRIYREIHGIPASKKYPDGT